MRSHLLLLFAFVLPAQHGIDPPVTVTLETMRDHARPLLVFAPTDKDPRFLEQVHRFAAAGDAMGEREVILVPLNARPEAASWGAVPNTHPLGRMSSEAAAEARRLFNIEPGAFTVLLLGKDGGEKLRSHTPVTARRLLQTIDSMPMRQQEIQDRGRERKTP